MQGEHNTKLRVRKVMNSKNSMPTKRESMSILSKVVERSARFKKVCGLCVGPDW